ncbi:MAG: electron transport complex subunit RsxC [Marinilabiliaceae bacterium]|nr:electron transport complex subunit RsxC [Marinilabiliaceae bacterium]
MKTFPKGGVHPPENKLTADSPIRILELPEQLTIPISQHIGAPARPVVDKGDNVKAGQLIAESQGFVSASIHSPVSGKVFRIDNVPDSSGYKQTSVIINVEGDEWADEIDTSKEVIREIKLSGEEIVKKCSEKGIVGMGGATFPSHVKLSVPPGKTCEVLIINGVECEPYLTSDHRIMLERGEELMVGVKLLMKALNVNRAVIGIENNKADAIKHLTDLSSGFEGIEVETLKVKYPQGGEKQLIKAIINREVPSGGLPIDVGTVVHNVGTALAVYEAVQKNKPLVERVVTVTGKHLSNPGNYLVRIGTPLRMLVEAAGGFPDNTGKIVNGGPMMGKSVASMDVPVTKGTSGVILFAEEESSRKQTDPCIRCAKCISACAMGLEPYLLMTLTEKKMYERAEKERIMDCMECGSCSYICPANRPLLDYIRLGKSNVGRIMRERKQK